jgi:hypothetical protein
MADEVLFAGGRRDSLLVTGGSPVEVTTSGRFDSTFADSAILLQPTDSVQHGLFTQTGGVLSSDTVVEGETLFVHFEQFNASAASGSASINLVDFRDSSGFPWLAVRGAGTPDTYVFVFNSGTGASPVWTAIGANFTLTRSALLELDIVLTLGSPHTATLYVGRSILRTGTFTQALLTNIAAIRYGSPANSGTAANNTHISQMMATRGISTLGAKVRYSRATGAGANTGWSGTHTAVNEAVGSDATLQNAATAGLISTHAMGDVTVSAGFEIKSVFHWLRAKNDGTSPNNIRSVLRSSGVDYATGNLSGMGLGYGPVGARYDTDPLGNNWTQSVWNAIEAGYESAT